jgi:hypothetical protein
MGNGATVGRKMAKVEKISVSLTPEELKAARRRAKRMGLSLSAVLNEALRFQRQMEARRQLLDELGTDDITPEDIAKVRAEWRR